jgi:predicted DNA-binding transcriptional regulator AlpA
MGVWTQLARRFRNVQNECDGRLEARWFRTGRFDGSQWQLAITGSSVNGFDKKFEKVARLAAKELGYSGRGRGSVDRWLDRLTDTTQVEVVKVVPNVCGTSAEYCFMLSASQFPAALTDQTEAGPGVDEKFITAADKPKQIVANPELMGEREQFLKPYLGKQTLSGIATASDVAYSSLYRRSRGKYRRLSSENRTKLAKHLKVKVEEFPNNQGKASRICLFVCAWIGTRQIWKAEGVSTRDNRGFQMATLNKSIQGLLNEHEVASLIGLSVASVRRFRLLRSGTRHLKLNSAVRYKREDIDTWLESRPTGGEQQEAR